MKREINSLVEEIYNYSLNLTESRSDLTEIQKKEYFKKINEELDDKGIITHIHYDDNNHKKRSFFIRFDLPETQVEGIGKLIDVKEFGSFPLLISVNHAIISYEPRDLHKLSSSSYGKIENTEFINLNKGDDIQIVGKISTCTSAYAKGQNVNLTLKVVGEAASEAVEKTVKIVQRENDERKRNARIYEFKERTKKVFMEALGAGIIGLFFYIAVAIICWLLGHNSGNIFYYILIPALIGEIIGYFRNYD